MSVVELIIARGIGRGRRAGRIAVGIQQFHGHAADPRFARVADAVVVGVVVDVSAQGGGQRFGEIVVDAVFAAFEIDVAEDIDRDDHAARLTVHGADRIAHAQVAGRLRFDDAIRAGQDRRRTCNVRRNR